MNPNLGKAPPFISRYRISARSRPAELADNLPCIFVAEDNPGDVDLLRIALEEHAVECDLLVAADGENALRFIEEIVPESINCPSIAVLDLNLPKKTGRELLRHIRENHNWARVPVIVLSSSDSEKDKLDSVELGATRYIRKPLNLDAFVAIGGILKQLLTAPL